MPRTFVTVHHVASEISQGLEQQMRQNFAEFSSETKVRDLFGEIRSHFFAQYCSGENRQFRNLSCVSVTLSYLQTDATTPNFVGLTVLRVDVSVCT